MVAVNAADDENAAAVTLFRPHPQSLPAYIGRGAGVSDVERLVLLFRLRLAGGGRLTKQIRQNHQGGVRHHLPAATSAVVGCGGEKRQKIRLIVNGGLSQRPWTGWRNQSKAGGGGTVGVI